MRVTNCSDFHRRQCYYRTFGTRKNLNTRAKTGYENYVPYVNVYVAYKKPGWLTVIVDSILHFRYNAQLVQRLIVNQ